MSESAERTPLSTVQSESGRFVPFAGWEIPVQVVDTPFYKRDTK